MDDQTIARINELYHKSQGEGLTPEEKEEQTALRKAYVESVRKNLASQLDNIHIQNEDGTIENLGEKHAAKQNQKGITH